MRPTHAPRLRRDMKRISELLALAREKHREKQLIKAVGYRPDGSLIMEATIKRQSAF